MPPAENLPIIDAVGEDWVLHTDLMIVSPLTFKKRWTKKEIIEPFNNSKTAKDAGLNYPVKSLSSKRFDRVAGEIAKLALKADKRLDRVFHGKKAVFRPHG